MISVMKITSFSFIVVTLTLNESYPLAEGRNVKYFISVKDTVFTSYLIFSFNTTRSKLFCAGLCLSDSDCVMFTYTSSRQNCRGHSNVMPDNSSAVAASGTRMYYVGVAEDSGVGYTTTAISGDATTTASDDATTTSSDHATTTSSDDATTTSSDPCSPPSPVTDCADLADQGCATSGVYTLSVTSIPVTAYCDLTTDGGKWMVFQRRQDGSENFNRNWADYKAGFGSASGEYWLGLENLHLITSSESRTYELRVDMTRGSDGVQGYAKYSSFLVGPETGYYVLTLGSHTGDCGNHLNYSNGYPFSTPDVDNDQFEFASCAFDHKAGFWFNKCTFANPNGDYFETTSGVWMSPATFWGPNFVPWAEHCSFIEYKIRPV